MTALRVRILLLAFATGALLGQSWTAHAASTEQPMSICFALREGASLASIETALLAQGYTSSQAGSVTGLAVRDGCPDLTQSVLSQARGGLT